MKTIFQAHQCLTEAEIRRYLEGTTDAEARHRVENHLLDCPLCEEAVEGYTLFFGAGRQQRRPFSILRGGRSQLRQIAAVILLLLLPLSGYLIWGHLQEGRLYQTFYESYESDLSMAMRRGATENPEAGIHPALLAGAEAYERGDFAASIPAFQQYLGEKPGDQLSSFYLGMAFLEEERYAEAIQPLQTAATAKSPYAEEAHWYLALAYIKLKDTTAAKTALQPLLEAPEGRYYEKAESLTSKL